MTFTYTEQDKGSPVLVTGGKYEGREGWMHTGIKQPKKMVYVILQATENQEETCVRILRKTAQETQFADNPRNFTEAVFKEHKDIAIDMQKLVQKLADVEGYEPNTDFLGAFWKMWEDAKTKRGQAAVRQVRIVSWQQNEANTTQTADTTQTESSYMSWTNLANGVAAHNTNNMPAVSNGSTAGTVPNVIPP